MEIKIRQKPQRSTGKTSLVLEYYYGYTRDDEGRIKHRRKFETLEYYLYTDPKNKLERDHNKVCLLYTSFTSLTILLSWLPIQSSV